MNRKEEAPDVASIPATWFESGGPTYLLNSSLVQDIAMNREIPIGYYAGLWTTVLSNIHRGDTSDWIRANITLGMSVVLGLELKEEHLYDPRCVFWIILCGSYDSSSHTADLSVVTTMKFCDG
ncbi:hypothetical protein M422DRAFT_50226 [Sphaerobolus stellatus SS14]|uniref:Uncharacterized protein n=1 Tax=Sphaerobolus stellatus (strain SS14) TaxID=990650 RepID=A0A0C9USU9_SPHS4|nr:hypothetical protein M422DRAFT_50226 [Sphaerobolus stellatus SS14]